MPIDASIYQNMQSADFGGAIDRGLRMRDMIEQRRDKDAVKKAYQENMTTGPDGKMALNRDGLTAKLMAINPQIGMEAQRGFTQDDQASAKAKLENQKAEIDKLHAGSQIVSAMTPENYLAGRAQLLKIDPSWDKHLPPVYDKKTLDGLGQFATTAVQRFDQQFKTAESVRDQKNKDRDAGLKAAELNLKKASGEQLPIDTKHFVDKLSTKNADKVAIKNQIDSVLSTWDKLSDDQKVTAGRQLIKTLNSTEGSDAVGAEESRRLGGKLEFALGNLTNSNPMQFGRDLSGFKEQALNVSKSIAGAVDSNRAEIDKAMGRKPSGGQFTPDVVDYATKHGISKEQALAIKNERTGNSMTARK